LRYALRQTDNRIHISDECPAVRAMEATWPNTVEPGRTAFLFAVKGLLRVCAGGHGPAATGEVSHHRAALGEAFTLAEIEAALAAPQPKILGHRSMPQKHSHVRCPAD